MSMKTVKKHVRHRKVIGRHKWLSDCIITEVVDSREPGKRHFIATVKGWRGFYIPSTTPKEIIKLVEEIRDRIEKGDETVFYDSRFEKPVHIKRVL